MRILVINWRDMNHPEAGGAEVHFHETFTRIANMGHDVTLLCSQFSGAPKTEEIDGIQIIRHGGKFTFNLTVPGYYRKCLADKDFDIIIEDLNKIPFFLPLFIKDRPILALVHHLFGTAVYRETNPVFATYVYLTERSMPYVYGSCPFEVVSESTRTELQEMGIPPGKIDVVHNGIDLDLFKTEQSFKTEPGSSIVYLGRLKRYKNVDRLIQAFVSVRSEVAGAKLTIVGEGDHRATLEAMVDKLGLREVVTFTGFISNQEKVAILTAAHVAAFPSDKEGWGLSVIEANVCNTPVVATRVPGLQDAVIHEDTGILVPLGDTDALARELTRLLKDDTLRNKMAERSALRAREFTWDRTADRTIEILTTAVENFRT